MAACIGELGIRHRVGPSCLRRGTRGRRRNRAGGVNQLRSAHRPSAAALHAAAFRALPLRREASMHLGDLEQRGAPIEARGHSQRTSTSHADPPVFDPAWKSRKRLPKTCAVQALSIIRVEQCAVGVAYDPLPVVREKTVLAVLERDPLMWASIQKCAQGIATSQHEDRVGALPVRIESARSTFRKVIVPADVNSGRRTGHRSAHVTPWVDRRLGTISPEL